MKSIATTVRNKFWDEVKCAFTEPEFTENFSVLQVYIESIGVDLKVVQDHLRKISDKKKREDRQKLLVPRLEELKDDMFKYFIDKDKTVVTVVDGGKYTCSRCVYTIGHGIICRHYFCFMVAAIADRSINVAFPIHASFIHNQWYKDGFCKLSSDLNQGSIWLRQNQLTVSSELKWINYNSYVPVTELGQFVVDDTGEVHDVQHDNLEVDQVRVSDDHSIRLKDDYRHFRQQFFKDMSEYLDIAEAAMVPIDAVQQIKSTFASQVLLQRDIYQRGNESNNSNASYILSNVNTEIMSSKKHTKKNQSQKNLPSSYDHRIALEVNNAHRRKNAAGEASDLYRKKSNVSDEEVRDEVQMHEVEVVNMAQASEVSEVVKPSKRYNTRRPKPTNKASSNIWMK